MCYSGEQTCSVSETCITCCKFRAAYGHVNIVNEGKRVHRGIVDTRLLQYLPLHTMLHFMPFDMISKC